MNLLLAFATAAVLGSVHALAPDHLAAVTAFAVQRRSPLATATLGIRWAFGHGLVVIFAGLLLMTLGLAIPAGAAALLDRLTGAVLIALGGWTCWHASRLHAHAHVHGGGSQHVHLHSHAWSRQHEHAHAPALVGALHGLAGAAPVIAMLQITRFSSVASGVGSLVSFALGTAAAMGVYAFLAGALIGNAALRSERWTRALGTATGVVTVAVGVLWLFR